MARDMYSQALQLGDKKAQCMALTLPVNYWYYQRNHPEQFFNAVDKLQKKATECNIEQYYYYGFSNKVNYLLVTGRINDAIEYIHEVEDYARSHKHYFGIYSGLNALALQCLAVHIAGHVERLGFCAYTIRLYIHII